MAALIRIGRWRGAASPRWQWIVLGLLLVAAAPALEAQSFYQERLRAGIAALDEGDTGNAVIELELACFGFLEDPSLRVRCKVHLLLAQLADDRREEALETLLLVAELERLHDAYSSADLATTRRAQFEAAIRREFSEQPLPVDLTPSAEEPTEGTGGVDAGEVGSGEADNGESDDGEDSTPPEDEATGIEAEVDELRSSSREAARDRDRDRLEQSLELGLELARRHPTHGELQAVIGRTAYLLGRWDLASEALESARSEAGLDASTLFYLAVSQYESGDGDAARVTLRESLDEGLEQTEFVHRYVRRILEDE